jgi:pilus assembly protein CpaD
MSSLKNISAPALVALALLAAGAERAQAQGFHEPAWAMGAPVEVRHPIYASKRATGVRLPIHASQNGLTYDQMSELSAWLQHWRSRPAAGITVRAPSGGPNEGASMAALDDVHVALRQAGVSRNDVRFENYPARSGRAPIEIRSWAYVVEGPDCGAWPTNLARDYHNAPYWNFGCATQNNLAAMIANPEDLIRPRRMTPRSSERRGVVWGKYIEGAPTGAEKSDDEKATVSDVAE